VSDITYVKVSHSDYYLSLITDAYSRRVVGYTLARSLEAKHSIKALKMALEKEGRPKIHHSDRGIQYCCYPYTTILQNSGVKISMSRKGDPLENAIAERINGIIKNEYLKYRKLTPQNYQEQIKEVIQLYNQERPHLSCKMKTPNEVHLSENNPLTTLISNKNKVLTQVSN
jgi:transposase InsO family protein